MQMSGIKAGGIKVVDGTSVRAERRSVMCRWKRERKAKAYRKSAVKVGGWVEVVCKFGCLGPSGAPLGLDSRVGQSGSVLKRAGTEAKS